MHYGLRHMDKSEKLIKSKRRVKAFAEVYTPKWLVDDMLDMLDRESGHSVFDSLQRTFLEPACGNGNYIVAIISRKLKLCKNAHDAELACASVYGIDIQQDNVDECRARVKVLVHAEYPDADIDHILRRNIVCGDTLHPETIWFLSKEEHNGNQ